MRIVPPAGFSSNLIPIVSEEDYLSPFNLGVEITGKLSQFKSPEIEIRIGNQVFKAIFDTGAYDSHISLFALQSLQIMESTGVLYSDHPNIGKSAQPSYKLPFIITGVNHNFSDIFGQMSANYQYPIIIGSKFIGRCKELRIFGIENTFKLSL